MFYLQQRAGKEELASLLHKGPCLVFMDLCKALEDCAEQIHVNDGQGRTD